MATNDLSWLNESEPVKASFIPTKRGRQPGPNPTAEWVDASFDQGVPLTKSVPAKLAHTVERAVRRYGAEALDRTGKAWEVSIQVLDKNPTQGAGPENVIPLSGLNKLEGDYDVWITVLAKTRKEKAAKPESNGTTSATAAPADPFQNEAPAESKPTGRKATK